LEYIKEFKQAARDEGTAFLAEEVRPKVILLQEAREVWG
jgi:hypothetical protein